MWSLCQGDTAKHCREALTPGRNKNLKQEQELDSAMKQMRLLCTYLANAAL